MPRTVETTIYSYAELSEDAKSRARDWYRAATVDDNDFAESVIEDAMTIADMLGLDISQRKVDHGAHAKPAVYWSLHSQGSGACFSGTYRYRDGSVAAIKDYASRDEELHRIAESLADAQSRHTNKLIATITTSGRYSHSHSMTVEVEHSDDADVDVSEVEGIIRDAIRGFADWIYSRLEAAFDYQNSNEAVAESIECNEYEFYENGDRA